MVFRAKDSTVGGNGGGGPRGVAFPVEGTIEDYHILAGRGSYGENPVLCGRATTAPFGVVPFLEAPHLGPVSACGIGGCQLVVLPSALQMWWCTWSVLAGWCRGPMGVASSWHVWCGGDLGVGWVEVLLSM
jgi:hypothetical protein